MPDDNVNTIPLNKAQFSAKQLEFLANSTCKFNLAHGSVRSGKTVTATFCFLHKVYCAPVGQQFWLVGHTLETIYRNVVSTIIESNHPVLSIFRPMCAWFAGKKELRFGDKIIKCYGAKDEGAVGIFQGGTCDIAYCDEMTLYPPNVLQMLISRLSPPNSVLIASMNPEAPSHKCHELIELAEKGDPNYYSLHFVIDDNPYLDEAYKQILRQTLSGLFYRRHYLGEWCLAEGAIFEFLDKQVHIVRRPPRAAEFWLAGIDYGASNPFACLLVGYHSGKYGQGGPQLWVEKEYYWDPKKTGRQKTNSEFARDMQAFLQDYSVRTIYVDPSAESFQLEMRKSGFHVVDAENDVYNGIMQMTNLVKEGTLVICDQCTNLIREMESYSWDPKASLRGDDEPIKVNDHCFIAGTKITTNKGQKNIEDIKEGDLVLTSIGLRPVLKTFVITADVNKYNIFGIEFKCTDSHMFFTLNRGFVKISEINKEDMLVINLCTIQLLKESNGTEKSINVIQNLKDLMTEITTACGTVVDSLTICTEIFGNPIMEKFHPDTIFITKIKILPTTVLITSNVSNNEIIARFMEKLLLQSKNGLLKTLKDLLNQKQKNGTARQKVCNGTENTQELLISEVGPQKNMFVNNAEKTIYPPKDRGRVFVQITVNRSGGELCTLMMSLESVRNVINLLESTNTLKGDSVPESVLFKTGGKQIVYDLMVADKHEFFAENILVHNSVDAMRYVVASFLKGRTTLRVPTPEEISEKQAEVQKMHWTKAADANRFGGF